MESGWASLPTCSRRRLRADTRTSMRALRRSLQSSRSSLRCLAERLLDQKEIAPGKPLLYGLPQQIGGMERRHCADFPAPRPEREPAPAHLENAIAHIEQRLGRGRAETHQDVRIGQL